MNTESFQIVFIGLTMSSSWGNGHATTYRSLVKGLHQQGHSVTFLEQNVPWYASNRDLNSSPFCDLCLYKNVEDLRQRYLETIRRADLVIVGSYLQNGVEVGNMAIESAKGLTAFYDIDTPITLSKLKNQDYEYITPQQIPEYDLYLSFSGGEVLDILKLDYGASAPRPLFCSVDTDLYSPDNVSQKWQLGYLGTYSEDRQPTLNTLLVNAAKSNPEQSFVIAGPQYPDSRQWPENLEYINHLPPSEHRSFYNRQLFTLNVTRSAMISRGYSPSVRLFEAAACGTPIISDYWDGLDHFFEPGEEILIAETTDDVEQYLSLPRAEIDQISEQAREKILKNHSSQKRAKQLVGYIREFKNMPVS